MEDDQVIANIYLFKVKNRKLEEVVKYVQS